MMLRFILAGFSVLALAGSAAGLEPEEQRGLTFAQANCASCHSIGLTGSSSLPVAPPFRTLHELYPVEDLAEALAEGIVTGHPSMPQFKLDGGQIGDLISYLKTLETANGKPATPGSGVLRGG